MTRTEIAADDLLVSIEGALNTATPDSFTRCLNQKARACEKFAQPHSSVPTLTLQ
ncbi:MAG: hypothetical protein ACJAZ8_000618 [Planctomycetota bacterium]|jgi:hypothetical protein